MSDIKKIQCLRDLEAYGVVSLTGEADALSFRMLCDVTESGRMLVCDTYGIEKLGSSWNSFSEGGKHVGSAMLPYDAWMALGIVALHTDRHVHTIVRTCSGVFGLTGNMKLIDAEWKIDESTLDMEQVEPYKISGGIHSPLEWPEWMYGKIERVWRKTVGDTSTRNTHQMSGRVE